MLRKKILPLILVSFCLLALPAQAAWKLPLKSRKAPAASSRLPKSAMRHPNFIQREQISNLLHRRARKTYQQAVKLQQELPPSRGLTIGEPVRSIRRPNDMPTERVYADKPFLTSRHQTADYMVAQSNRLFIREVARMRQLWNELDKHLDELKQAAANTPQPADPIAWLARQIPADTSILFVGEMHGYGEIHEATAQLLGSLRQRHPTRRIVLLTEFLTEDFHYTADVPTDALHLPDFEGVWQEALSQHIEVIGLEPMHVMNDTCEMKYRSRDNGKMKTAPQWAHLEGVRLRNEAWVRTLEKYRAQDPEALFVVYSGAAHSMYNFPFTLSTALTKEVPFVATFYPETVFYLATNNWLISSLENAFIPLEEPLERMTHPDAFPQQTIHFQDPHLAKLAGFNVRVKLPISTQRYYRDHGF